jgi:hypothetical protein
VPAAGPGTLDSAVANQFQGGALLATVIVDDDLVDPLAVTATTDEQLTRWSAATCASHLRPDTT